MSVTLGFVLASIGVAAVVLLSLLDNGQPPWRF